MAGGGARAGADRPDGGGPRASGHGGRGVPVAITGMAVLLPGAGDLAAYWRNLAAGADAIGEVPEGRWDAAYYHPEAAAGPAAADRVYCRRGGFVDALADVDAARFGIMPSSVPGTEPDQLIALQVAASAIADAGGEDRLPARERVGVVLGRGGYLTPGLVRLDQRVRTAAQLVHTLGELLPDLVPEQLARVREAFTERLGPDRPENAIGLVPHLAASRLANRLDLRGPAYTVDAACASSLVAVDQAVGELASGRCDVVLAGGVHHCHDITLWSVFSQLRALSPSQRIRPFHRDADGILIGEGTGVVVLKRLADAARDGDRVYAVVRGTAVGSDGRTAGLTNPDPRGQVRTVRQAWQAAGLDPAEPGSLGLLEAHGTATPAGDTAELSTLREVFGAPDGQDRHRGNGNGNGDRTAVIGSVKSMIGHAMPAAGVAGLVKAALAVHHATLLPTLHCDDPHPALAGTRFRPLAEAEPWGPGPGGAPRRAAVNAFGFGGVNAHVVLEQAPQVRPFTAAPGQGAALPAAAAGVPAGRGGTPAVTAVTEPERVLLLSAETPEDLAAQLDADDSTVLASGLTPGGRPGGRLGGRIAGRARLGIVGPTPKRLALARRVTAKGRAWQGRSDVWFAPYPLLGGERPGRIAFVFPGLEAEFEPRVDDVAQRFGPVGSPPGDGTAARVGDIGRHGLGVVAVGRLLDSALRRMGVVPEAVAGHSIGEWTAMAAAGLYSARAVDEFTASLDPDSVTVPDLAFAAVGAPADRVVAELTALRLPVTLSHDNAPSQSMVCGPPGAVGEFVRVFRTRGVLCRVLPFRSGFHTPMLEPSLGPFRAAAERFALHPPTVPVWSGTTASPFPADEAAVRELFVRHLLEPVRFRQLTESLHAAGFRAFVQVGTGALGSLIGDTLAGRDHLAVAANSPHRPGLAQLRRVAVALWTVGAAVDPCVVDHDGTTPAGPADADADAGGGAGAGGPGGAAPGGGGGGGGSTVPPRLPVRLDLGGGLVSLDPGVLAGLRLSLRGGRDDAAAGTATTGTAMAGTAAAAPTAPGTAGPAGAPAAEGTATRPGAAAGAGTGRPANRSPALAELDALMRETAAAAAEVVEAAGRSVPARRHGGAAHTRAAVPPPRPPWARPARPSSGPGPAAPPDGPWAALPQAPPDGTGPWASRGRSEYPVRVGIAAMPYLLDHCFFRQRADWPEVADRWPVVPATTIVHHLMEAAERSAPGTRAVAVHDARFDRWLPAAEPTDVAVGTAPSGPGRVAVSFGPYARGVVEVAARYPAPPPVWDPAGLGGERAPEHSAAQLYAERWMFHGPAYQGVTALRGIGRRHVRALLTAPSAPGALLDSVGQVLGYWIMATGTERTVVFPVRMRQMRFFGPAPRPGSPVGCLVRVTSLTRDLLEADVQLTSGGGVWAELTGWQDRRFDNDPHTRPVERFPERHALSEARPGGWALVHERWPDLASRDLIMRNMLGSAERAAYEGQSPRGRRQWLLGRIAAKDAVRQWLWQRGEGPVFPAELRVDNDERGRPRVTGTHGRTLPPLAVSLAHRAEAAVAIVRPCRPLPDADAGADAGAGPGPGTDTGTGAGPGAATGPGIDIEEIAEPSAATLAAALAPAEQELLIACHTHTAEGDGGRAGASTALWFTRFWAAKEAAAKAEGTGFGGRPKDFAVVAASGHRMSVEVRGAAGTPVRVYRIRCAQVANPPGLPPRSYVVAWTEGPERHRNGHEEDRT
ncbi:type I polyketide synthase [Streptomyces pacificus]|uniref:Type I polyketide synthase n=1 Tax=Streptomyces pacificus TaxID=2705029 RepID=A0A6A0AZF3_9ACTN|nr:type I polyketide synthase [Streptomyces pacificus]GFH38350.1 type I polyketide synthase [Streptomyces pacificus]